MDLQYPAWLHGLADFSHTTYGDDELVAKAYGCGLGGDLWIDNHNIGLRKEHFCQGSIRLQTSRADIVGDTRRASDIWSALVGGDSRAGTGLSVSTNRVTSRMPPAIRTSATRVFVMARSLFIIPKIWERWAGHIEGQPSPPRGCDCPRHRSRPTCQGIGGVKAKLRLPGGTHSLAAPSVRPQNLQTIGLV